MHDCVVQYQAHQGQTATFVGTTWKIKGPIVSKIGKGQNQLMSRTQANKSKWHMLEIQSNRVRNAQEQRLKWHSRKSIKSNGKTKAYKVRTQTGKQRRAKIQWQEVNTSWADSPGDGEQSIQTPQADNLGEGLSRTRCGGWPVCVPVKNCFRSPVSCPTLVLVLSWCLNQLLFLDPS